MIDKIRIERANTNFKRYLDEKILVKEYNDKSKQMYIENAEISLKVAVKLSDDNLNPHIWTIVTSYYAMFYIANAVILHLGFRIKDKIVHQATNDALIVLVMDKLQKELLNQYEETKEDALELSKMKAEEIISTYEFEKDKRSRFQYEMTDELKKEKAKTSLNRAITFVHEMKKLIEDKKTKK